MTAACPVLQERPAIDLRLGEPGLPTPEGAVAAATEAIAAGLTRYTPAGGLPELRTAVAEKFSAQGIACAAEDTIVGCGAKLLLLALLLGEELAGGEVIVPAPHYGPYPGLVRLAGGVPRVLATRPVDGYKLTPAQLRSALGPRTRWLILNSPNNPTGAVYSETEVRALAAELALFPAVRVLSDEIYEDFRYDGVRFSTATLGDDLARRTVTVSGVSKTYSMTGWRIGYACGPRTLIEGAIRAQFSLVTCPPSVSQAAAIGALRSDQAEIHARNTAFVTRRDAAVAILRDSRSLEVHVPQGAFYLFPRLTRPDADDVTVAAQLARAGVLVTPGWLFGAPGHFRMSFALEQHDLEEACRRIVAALHELDTKGNAP